MPDITITGLRVAPGAGDRTPTYVDAYPLTDFLLADGVTAISAQSPYNAGAYYKRMALTPGAPYYSAADFTLPPTTNSPDNPNGARWGLFVKDALGRLMYPAAGLSSFQLEHTTPTQDAEDIVAYNSAGLPTYTPGPRTVSGDLIVGGDGDFGGAVTATSFTGSGAGLHSLPSGVVTPNSLSSTGSVSLNADTEVNGVGEAALVVGGVTKFRAKEGGAECESLVPLIVPAVASDAIPSTGLVRGSAPAEGFYLDGARVAAPFDYLWLPDFNPSNASDWTTPLNDAIALAQTLGNGHTIQLPSGVHNIDGPSLDPSGGNAQILLPEGSATQQFSLTIRGSGPPAMMNLGPVDSGTVLKSTPTSGTGSMMGVVGTAFVENRAILNINFEDLTFQMPPNPTRSALDLSHVTMPQGRNLRFWTGEGFDAVTEPTTATSAAIKMPAGLAGQHANFGRIAISGFYRGIEWAELTQVIDANISNCHSALYVNDAPHGTITQTHGSIGMGLVLIDNKYDIDVDPATTYHVFKYLDIDTERYVGGGVAGQVDKWFNSVAEVNDPNHALRGELLYHVDYPVATFIADIVIVGGRYLVARPAFKPYWNRNVTEIFSTFRAQDNAVHEIRHGAATSNTNNAAWLSLVTNRTDNSNVVGGVAFSNSSLGSADKRIAQISGNTAGAPDAGALYFAVRSAGGALAVRAFFDSLGNLELQTAGKGLILTSPNGTRYVLTVSNAGALVITAA